MAGAPDMSFWLGRKYAIMQQEADATTRNADTNSRSADANIALTNTRNALLPKESAAQIAKMGADTAFTQEQTRWFGPTARANIARTNADTELTGTQNRVLTRNSLTPFRSIFGEPINGAGGLSRGSFGGFELPSLTRPARLPGESGADYMDRTNWGPY